VNRDELQGARVFERTAMVGNAPRWVTHPGGDESMTAFASVGRHEKLTPRIASPSDVTEDLT
jgi:hypothetical protein